MYLYYVIIQIGGTRNEKELFIIFTVEILFVSFRTFKMKNHPMYPMYYVSYFMMARNPVLVIIKCFDNFLTVGGGVRLGYLYSIILRTDRTVKLVLPILHNNIIIYLNQTKFCSWFITFLRHNMTF